MNYISKKTSVEKRIEDIAGYSGNNTIGTEMPESYRKQMYIELQETVPVKIVRDYRNVGKSGVIDLGTYTKLDRSEEAQKFVNEVVIGREPYLMRKRTLCNCLIKPVEIDGKEHVLMGRNMDLPNSFYPLLVFRMAVPGKYRSVNVSYLNYNMETFDQIAETGTISKDYYDAAPFMPADVVNEKGLFIEANMRQPDDGVQGNGTNSGKTVMNEMSMMRHWADNCATIEEAIEYAKQFDLYAANSDVMRIHVAYGMMDATGRFGTLEIANGTVYFNEYFPGQTNFWIYDGFSSKTDIQIGYGRWEAMMKQYHEINDFGDMVRVMNSMRFSRLFRQEIGEIPWDPRTDIFGYIYPSIRPGIEEIIEIAKANNISYDKKLYERVMSYADRQDKEGFACTTSFILDPKNAQMVFDIYKLFRDIFVQLPAYAMKTCAYDECSDIQTVYDNTEFVMRGHFFEQDDWYCMDPMADGDAMTPMERPDE